MKTSLHSSMMSPLAVVTARRPQVSQFESHLFFTWKEIARFIFSLQIPVLFWTTVQYRQSSANLESLSEKEPKGISKALPYPRIEEFWYLLILPNGIRIMKID